MKSSKMMKFWRQLYAYIISGLRLRKFQAPEVFLCRMYEIFKNFEITNCLLKRSRFVWSLLWLVGTVYLALSSTNTRIRRITKNKWTFMLNFMTELQLIFCICNFQLVSDLNPDRNYLTMITIYHRVPHLRPNSGIKPWYRMYTSLPDPL